MRWLALAVAAVAAAVNLAVGFGFIEQDRWPDAIHLVAAAGAAGVVVGLLLRWGDV